jgi:hypothetical protein
MSFLPAKAPLSLLFAPLALVAPYNVELTNAHRQFGSFRIAVEIEG